MNTLTYDRTSPLQRAPTQAQLLGAIARAFSEAKRWSGAAPRWMDPEEFAAEALLAVARAVHDFPEKGRKPWEVYVLMRIRHALQHARDAQDVGGRRRREWAATGHEELRMFDQRPLSLDALLIDAELEESAGVSMAECDWELPWAATSDPDPHSIVVDAAELARLMDAVSALPARERYVLVRRYWHGESLAAIGHALGVSGRYALTIERRALASLARALSDETGPGPSQE